MFSKHNFNICDHVFKTQFHLKDGFGSAFAASTFAATHILAFFSFSRKGWLSIVNSARIHCLWTHKYHFSIIFLLKMSHTILFTHLKIILLQYFQFFSFNKISSIQTDQKCHYFNFLREIVFWIHSFFIY